MRFSDNAERYLNQLGIDLLLGKIELHQLPPSLMQFYEFAFEAGRQSLLPDLEKAQDQRDQFYERWLNPGRKYPELQQRRMRAGSEEYWVQLLKDWKEQAESRSGTTKFKSEGGAK
ncbi:hypothetical protein [Humibacter soli]